MLAFMSDCGGSDGSDGSVEVAQWFQDLARSTTARGGASWQVVVTGDAQTKERMERFGETQERNKDRKRRLGLWKVDVRIASRWDNSGRSQRIQPEEFQPAK